MSLKLTLAAIKRNKKKSKKIVNKLKKLSKWKVN